MVETTVLHPGELDQSSGDAEIDALLAEAKRLSGRNYQVVTRGWLVRRGFRRRWVSTTSLYVEVPGVFNWQVLEHAQSTETTRAFLLGVIEGCTHGSRP